MTKAWMKSYSRVDLSWLIPKYKKGDAAYSISDLTAQVIERKLDRVLDKLKCAAKFILALGFILKNKGDGKFVYFFAHKNNTLLEQSKHGSNKIDRAKLKEVQEKSDVIESCTKERSK